MAKIELENVHVDFPVFDAQSRSLKKHVLGIATGGYLRTNNNGKVVVNALNDINLRVENGERVGIVGHNGSGKSTLLRILNGVYSPTSGESIVTGSVGSLIDISLGIDPEVSGRENIYLRSRLLGENKQDIQNRLDEVIEFSQLGEFIDMPLRTYSSGMALRLAFSVATSIKCDILLMDEWLSVGDESFKHQAEEKLRDLINSSNILVIATHSKEQLLSTCNRVIWLEHGKVKMDGSAESVVNAYFG